MRIFTSGLFFLCALILAVPGASNATSPQTPEQVIQAYIAAMKRHDASRDLPIYSRKTREMMRDWNVNRGQMDNVVRTHASCSAPQSFIKTGGTHAVVRYGVDQRKCNPYFLVMEDNAWRLDLTMMRDGIRFNHRNQWHFVMDAQHPYWFAFEDWRLDEHGFPHPAW